MKPSAILKLARFAYPHCEWIVTRGGAVVNNSRKDTIENFSLDNPHDLQAVEMKLRQQGWIIHRETKDGKPWFRASKAQQVGTSFMVGGPEAATLERLLVVLVG